jgi:hypothetical protein
MNDDYLVSLQALVDGMTLIPVREAQRRIDAYRVAHPEILDEEPDDDQQAKDEP